MRKSNKKPQWSAKAAMMWAVVGVTFVYMIAEILGSRAFGDEFVSRFREFVRPVVLTVSALLAVVGMIWVWQQVTGVPLDAAEPLRLLRKWLGLGTPSAKAQAGRINIECWDSSGRIVDLGPNVRIEMRNSHDKKYRAESGVFMGCNAHYFEPGAHVELTVGGAFCRYRAQSIVQIEPVTQRFYVAFEVSLDQILEQIYGKANSKHK